MLACNNDAPPVALMLPPNVLPLKLSDTPPCAADPGVTRSTPSRVEVGVVFAAAIESDKRPRAAESCWKCGRRGSACISTRTSRWTYASNSGRDFGHGCGGGSSEVIYTLERVRSKLLSVVSSDLDRLVRGG
jgi:hypothetical protein